MSKANQKFVQADEAVSPVIGVILMVAITVVLAAVVFVLVSNLSKTSDKSEDAAYKADSPTAGQIHVTMIKMGANGPYAVNTADTTTADDTFVTLDGALCDVGATAGTVDFGAAVGDDGEALSLTSAPANAEWGAGEVMIFTRACDAVYTAGVISTVGTLLASSSEHRVQVTVRGTLIFEGNVIVR